VRLPLSTVWKATLSGTEPSLGPAEALVTFVAWGDYECPFSRRLSAALLVMQEEDPPHVRVVWRHNPLGFHLGAMPAAYAACAAQNQGRFWEYHRKLFERGGPIDDARLTTVAGEAGLDLTRFDSDRRSPECRDRIAADVAAGTLVGVIGTPFVFINGKRVKGFVPVDDLRSLRTGELEIAEKLVASGIAPGEVYEAIVSSGKVFQAFEEAVHEFSITSPTKGAGSNAVYVLTMFADFECPHSAKLRRTLDDVLRYFHGLTTTEFRQFPLPFHRHAHLAAEASLAAYEQGKFWQMHERMFTSAKELDRGTLDSIARRVDLDEERFAQALDSGKYSGLVDDYVREGTAAGVTGTPALFVNGRRYVGQLDDSAAIIAAIKAEGPRIGKPQKGSRKP